MEDAILLKGFKRGKKPKEIEGEIQRDLEERILIQKQNEKDPEEFEKKMLEENKKRKLLNKVRPGNCWNFFENDPDYEKVKHVLRADAKPESCYCDGRVQSIMTNIEEIAANLRNYEEKKWNQIRKNTVEIFKAKEQEIKKAHEAMNE